MNQIIQITHRWDTANDQGYIDLYDAQGLIQSLINLGASEYSALLNSFYFGKMNGNVVTWDGINMIVQ